MRKIADGFYGFGLFRENYSEMVIKGEDLNHLHIAGRVVETKAKW